jgi:single-stranded-DNA-specific exonuclease
MTGSKIASSGLHSAAASPTAAITPSPPRRRAQTPPVVWRILRHDRDRIQELASALKAPMLIGHLLLNRGICDVSAARVFFNDDLLSLHDPATLPGVPEAADRLVHAIRNNRSIVIYSDYDADGVCGAGVLYRILKQCGARRLSYYIPSRFEEGYGLNAEALRTLARQRRETHRNGLEGDRSSLKTSQTSEAHRADLVVTVDCGITAVREAELARELGLELIITDHHHFVGDPPRADVVVHPRLPGSRYPFDSLCGAGVAYKLAWEVARRCYPNSAPLALRRQLDECLALVALATVTDVMPLKGENRIIVQHGLDLMNQDPGPGLAALVELIAKRPITSGVLGFHLGPRINVAGRLESAYKALDLLIGDDPERARSIAQELDQFNQQRQQVEREMVEHARAKIERQGDPATRGGLVVVDPSWHVGVVGIVASRLTEIFHRPTLVGVERDGLISGSGRSVPGFSLYDALASCRDLFESFGGHSAAAGFKLPANRLADLIQRFDDYCQAHLTPTQRKKQILIDAETPLALLTLNLVRWIDRLAPFGLGNREPVLLAHDVKVVDSPKVVGSQQSTLKFKVCQAGSPVFKAICFKRTDHFAEILKPGTTGSLVFQAQLNSYRGQDSVQLEVLDFRRPQQDPVEIVVEHSPPQGDSM